jgi:excisionase family DNA binding protein
MQKCFHSQDRACYSVNETIGLLNMGRTTLYKLIKRGELRKIKLGRKTLIAADDLAALLTKLRAAADARRELQAK